MGAHETLEAAAFLTGRLGFPPAVGVVLGSGLDTLVEQLSVQTELEYADVPGWMSGWVAGHAGRLLLCRRQGVPLVVLAGRVHGYEGFDLLQQQLMVRSLARWGVRGLLLTNAAGGLDGALRPRDGDRGHPHP